MNWFRNMKIGLKLTIAFGIVIALAITAGVLGYMGMISIDRAVDNEANNLLPSVQSLLTLNASSTLVQANANLLGIPGLSDSQKQGAYDKIESEKKTISDASAQYDGMDLTKDERQDWNASQQLLKAWLGNIDSFVAASHEADKTDKASGKVSANRAQLQSLLTGDLNSSFSALDQSLVSLSDYNMHESTTSYAESKKQSGSSKLLLILFLAAAVLVAVGLAAAVSGSISKPVKSLVAAADKLASGDTGIQLKIDSRDEIGLLARAFGKVLGSLNSLIGEMNNMSEQHNLGDIDVMVAQEKFDGAYRAVAVGVNSMVAGHIAVNKKAMACVAEFSRGNFEAPLEPFPGNKAFINDNIELLRKNLKALISDADMLVDAAVEGRLSTRADAARHQGDFRKIVDGVNRTLDAVIEPVNETARVLNEMSKGNLSMNVVGNYKGDHAAIKHAMNDTINTIKSYIGEIAQVLTEVADGNLNTGIDKDYRGDFIQIKDSINNIVDSLSSVLGDIYTSAEQVASGTQQVSAGSQALSQGATEQASAIEQLTASVGEIAQQTRENASNSTHASNLAMEARSNAVDGNAQMKEMQQAMAGINDASANISRIIKVIDEIAFQTNLLALNAAVEAARAGQHGKGFAVVAEEVRSLALRSAAAAKESTVMIEESIKKVKDGTVMADQTAQALQMIVGGVEKAASLVGGIAKASNDQASAVAQVNRGIEQVSLVVQTNSATAEESAAASEELSSQATLMKEMVGRFKLSHQHASGSSGGRVSPAAVPDRRITSRERPTISLSNTGFGKNSKY